MVHDGSIIPVRVKKWADISGADLFAAMEDKFENSDPNIKLEVYKTKILEHGM